MKKEQLEARKSEIVARLNELKRDVAPVGNRILTFQAIGLIAGVVWAWKTKQKWYIKPIAGIGGALAANLISSLTLSNDSSKKAAEIAQLQAELNKIDGELQWTNLRKSYSNQ